ncbi:MAG: hypothetical protein M3512_10950 [Bacteroidota bacterium]|jgi:hypothetical protein|nr:hypothetical protein [Bacteroidota bacterium]
MKFFIFIFIALILFSCKESTTSEQEYNYVKEYKKDTLNTAHKSKSLTSRPGYNRYTNSQYNISLEYPKDWNYSETGPKDSLQVISFYKVQDTYNHRFPISMETNSI